MTRLIEDMDATPRRGFFARMAGAAALGPAVACIAVASHRIRPRAAATVAAATAEASAESP